MTDSSRYLKLLSIQYRNHVFTFDGWVIEVQLWSSTWMDESYKCNIGVHIDWMSNRSNMLEFTLDEYVTEVQRRSSPSIEESLKYICTMGWNRIWLMGKKSSSQLCYLIKLFHFSFHYCPFIRMCDQHVTLTKSNIFNC